jgi:hypothetical protein
MLVCVWAETRPVVKRRRVRRMLSMLLVVRGGDIFGRS